MEPENFDILLCVAGVLMRLERWSGWFCIIYILLLAIYIRIEALKTVKILLKTWVRLFWTIQKINQRDSNEENVFSFLDDIMKSGIHKNIESSWTGFKIDVRLTILSTNEIEENIINMKTSYFAAILIPNKAMKDLTILRLKRPNLWLQLLEPRILLAKFCFQTKQFP